MNDEWIQIGHAAKSGGLFEGEEELANAVAIASGGTIDFGGASGGDSLEERFALKSGAAFAIGPAMLEDKVEPFFDQGWGAVPEEGVLEDDDVVVEEEFLFSVDIDHVVGVEFVKMADGDTFEGFGGGHEVTIDARAMGHRMGVEEEDSASHEVQREEFPSGGWKIQRARRCGILESGLTWARSSDRTCVPDVLGKRLEASSPGRFNLDTFFRL